MITNRLYIYVLLPLLIALFYLLPQIRYQVEIKDSRLNAPAVYLQVDEPSYAIRLTRSLQGQFGKNPWLFEHRDSPTLLPTFPEWCISLPLRLLGGDTNRGVILSRALLPVLSFFFFLSALRFLGFSGGLAALCAAWVLIDPGIMDYKPLIGLVRDYDHHPFNRFSNPLFGIALFAAAWGAGARAFVGPGISRFWSTLAGVLVGLSFYVSVYYWTHLACIFFFAALLVPTPQRWKTLGMGFAAALVVSLPYWYSVIQLQKLPVAEFLPWRNGLLIRDRGVYLLGHKALLIFIGAAFSIFFQRGIYRPSARFLLASVLGGLVCYFSSLLTGLSLQNFHWHYTLAPVLFFAAAWSAHGWLGKIIPRQVLAGTWAVLFTLALASGLRTAWRSLDLVQRSAIEGVGTSDV
jgi:hypothetical protein